MHDPRSGLKKANRAAGVFQEPLSASRQSHAGEYEAAPAPATHSTPQTISRGSSSESSNVIYPVQTKTAQEDPHRVSEPKQSYVTPQRFPFELLHMQVDAMTLLDLSFSQGNGDDPVRSMLAKISQVFVRNESIMNINLAGNKLTDEQLTTIFAALVGRLGALESLDLSSNALTDVSLFRLLPIVSQAKSLQELHLEGNNFTSRSLQTLLHGTRDSLRSLDLSHVHLTTGAGPTNFIGISRFSALSRLDVAYCGLTDATFAALLLELPSSLITLNAKGNCVVTLPDTIGTLVNLRHLDLSCNRLEQLSYALVNLPELESDFTGNPQLVCPPRETLLAGSVSLRTWLKANFYGTNHPRVRLLFLGNDSASKTVLIRNLYNASQLDKTRNCSASVQQEPVISYSTSDPESYPHVMDLDGKTRASVINFPGHIERNRLYVPFLTTRNAIYVITLDTSQSSDKQLGRLANYWLSMLQFNLGGRNNNVHVVLVATVADARPLAMQELEALLKALRYQYPGKTLSIEEHIYTTTSQPSDVGVTQLLKCIRKKASELLSIEANARVPDFFRQLEQFVVSSQLAPVLDFATFKRSAIAGIVDPRIIRYGDLMWIRGIHYLHETGAVLRSANSSNICLQPDGLIRLIAEISRRGTSGIMSTNTLMIILRNQHAFSRATHMELQKLLELMESDLGILRLNEQECAMLNFDDYWLPFQREEAELCMLPGLFSTRTRYSGFQFVDDDQDEFAVQEVFFSYQLQLRPYYDLRYRLFANVTLLQHGNSRALVHYVAKAHAINVVVVGAPSPQEFMRTLETMLKDVVARRLRREQCTMRQLCPRCIQGAGIYSTVDANGKACSAGHTLSVEDMQQGVLWEKRSWCRNSIWTSKMHEVFYSNGDWNFGDRVKRTVLTAADRDTARMKEYGRVRDMFYHFVREDSVRTFELDRVIFIDNLDLETSFQCFFERCIERFMSASYVDDSALAFQHEDSVKKQWRRWVMDHFEAYQERRSGNNAVNMVPAWHGTSEEVMLKIAEGNFLEPDELPPEKQTDPGYFGKGIYFTQYPSYGAQYVKDNKCLLFSWVIMGRPYPVIESPTDSNNLLGRGLMPGYDSHYVTVRQVSPQVYHPCKISETPDYDEMVVFSKNQILPRYIIYYRQRESDINSPMTLTSSTHRRHLFWVDDNLHGETRATLSVLRTQHPSISCTHVTSTHELVVWLSTHEELFTNNQERDTIRVVTCRYRERDGGSQAAERLIDTLKSDSKTRHVKVLVYCGNPKEVSGLEDKKQCFVSNDPATLKEFASFKSFGSDASAARLLQPLRNLWSRKEDERNSRSGSPSNRSTRIVIWIDDKPNPSASVIASQCAAQRIALVSLTSTTQLMEWVAAQGNALNGQSVRVITNRYRQHDGADNAAQLLLQWLRGSERLSQSALLIFCGDVSKVVHLADASHTLVTDDGNVALRFAMFEPLERLTAGSTV